MLLLHVENTKSPYTPPPTPSPRSGASRRRILDSYENTDFFFFFFFFFFPQILIFRCKNTEIVK